MRRERGFTLIELLIVVAIVGVLAAIAIPNLINAMNRARQKRTMADIRGIAVAWEARAVEESSYAPSGMTLCCTVAVTHNDMEEMLAPTFIKNVARLDGWDNTLVFAVNDAGTSYLIRSHGRGGIPDSDLVGGATTKFDCDIVYSNGAFIQYPDGLQGN